MIVGVPKYRRRVVRMIVVCVLIELAMTRTGSAQARTPEFFAGYSSLVRSQSLGVDRYSPR